MTKKKIREQVREMEKEHRLVAENLIDAIWTMDVDTLRFEYITQSIERISGYRADEYVNRHVEDRLTPESFHEISAVLAEEIPRFEKGIKKVRSVEVELIHKTGTSYWAEIRARLVREEGKKIKIIGVIREITERKKAQQRQDELIIKLGEALAEKEKLLAEVKTLRGLLPICSGCKRIRDEDGKWWPLDAYVKKATEAELTHTICLDCKDIFYGKS